MKVCVISTKNLSYPAGSQALSAHILEALKDDHEVTFVNFNKNIDWNQINSYYGTKLSPEQLKQIICLRTFIHANNVKFWFLKKHLAMRFAKKHNQDYDIFFSASGELDFGRRGIQYINIPIPKIFTKRSYTLIGKLNNYICKRLSNASMDSMKKNFTIGNSNWASTRIKETYGIESTIVYPPIKEFGNLDDFSFDNWQKRDKGFLAIGRISRDKKIENIIEIMDKVYSRCNEIKLLIIGHVRDQEYYDELKVLAKNKPWVTFHIDLSRKDLENLILKNKFGLHAKPDERFGMGVAEMVYGGLLVFVPNGGGQVEIVNRREQLIYASIDEAAEKILNLLTDNEMQSRIFLELNGHRMVFTQRSFKNSILAMVNSFRS